MTACSKTQAGEEVSSGLFGNTVKNELFRVGEVSCTVPEYMVLLTNTQNQYESVYGRQIWEVKMGEITLKDNVKDTVLAKVAQIKTMSLMAQKRGLSLTEEQRGNVQSAAAEYYGSLSETELTALGVTLQEIEGLYEQYALANVVYQQIVDGVDPEISDEEARTITVDQIHMKTYTIDSQGTRIEYSQTMKAEVEEDMYDILEFATEDGRDFTELAAKYNEADTVRISFRKGDVHAAIENAGFSLETEEVSDVIETQDGYYLLKCISTYDKEQTEANKQLIAQERKNEAFGKEYDAFVENLSKTLNEKLWKQMDWIQDDDVNTDSFFEVYEKYFGGM